MALVVEILDQLLTSY